MSTLEKIIEDTVRRIMNEKKRSIPLVVANWKMNMTLGKAKDFFEQLTYAPYPHCKVVCCPPYPLLYPLVELMKEKGIALGAQNVHEQEHGAHTGEVHAELLNEIGCEYVIVGHSERRLAGETDDQIAQKVKQVISHGLIPILCIGETKIERDQGIEKQIICNQIRSGLSEIHPNEYKYVLAYEPIWAIGTGETATPMNVQEIHRYIRELLTTERGTSIAASISLLYGGSVKADNINELLRMEDIDGALVGGASLSSDSFEAMITAVQ